MNTIKFSPQVSSYNNIQSRQRLNNTSFTGGKKITPQQAKKTGNFIQQLYSRFFVPCGENLKGIKDEQVFTEKFTHEGNIRISKRYDMWSKRPNAVIKDNGITSLREKTVFRKDGLRDIEIQDIYTPDYPVKVGYKGVDSLGTVDDGSLSITYGERSITLTNEERERLCQELNETLGKKFNKNLKELTQMKHEEFEAYYKDFYTTPETTATSILMSQSSLEEQLEVVPRSLPYGIECIMNKLGKM